MKILDRLAKNFRRREFACKCGCGFDTVDYELLSMLQSLRDIFGSLKINSGCRCREHNKKVGGALTSYHMRGRAADIVPLCYNLRKAYLIASDKYECGMALNLKKGFIHIDSRGFKATWGY